MEPTKSSHVSDTKSGESAGHAQPEDQLSTAQIARQAAYAAGFEGAILMDSSVRQGSENVPGVIFDPPSGMIESYTTIIVSAPTGLALADAVRGLRAFYPKVLFEQLTQNSARISGESAKRLTLSAQSLGLDVQPEYLEPRRYCG